MKNSNSFNSKPGKLFGWFVLLIMAIISPSCYAQEKNLFYCESFDIGNGTKVIGTKIRLNNGENAILIGWKDLENKTGKERCEEATKNITSAYNAGEYILSVNKSDGSICSTTKVGEPCQTKLFDIPNNDGGDKFLNMTFRIQENPNEANKLLQGERYILIPSNSDGWNGSPRPYYDLKELRNQLPTLLKLNEKS